MLDELSPEERELVTEYGFDRAIQAMRQFYGRMALAREYLEEERKLLQVERLKNIRLGSFAASLKHW